MNLYGQSCPKHSSKGSSVLGEDSIGNIAKQKLGAYFIQQPTTGLSPINPRGFFLPDVSPSCSGITSFDT
jgi:hypothetical protein